MARNLPQHFPQARQPDAWRHLRALDCDIEKQVAVNLSVKNGNLVFRTTGGAIGTQRHSPRLPIMWAGSSTCAWSGLALYKHKLCPCRRFSTKTPKLP